MGKRKVEVEAPDAGAGATEAPQGEQQHKQKKTKGSKGAAAGLLEEARNVEPSGAAPQQHQPPQQQQGKPAPVLPWMRVPVAIEASEGVLLEEVQGLDSRLRSGLTATGVEVLFPVQTVVWQETAGGSSSRHDVCISAPTGSGKTLAYALPVLQALARRVVPGLRALVVLPTRDLATQVFQVFASLCPSLGLTACVACGKASLSAEAALLVGTGGAPPADILVATPGRLISHLEGTPGLDLSRLGFLVIDETDRLLRQAYQDWLPKLLAAAAAAAAAAAGEGPGGSELSLAAGLAAAGASAEAGPGAQQQEQQQQQQQLAAAAGDGVGGNGTGSRGAGCGRLVKFVVSATLTRDPSKLERLGLHCPRYIATSAVDHRYKLPRNLQEFKLVAAAETKPLALAALLGELRGEATIVFTSSVEASHRLCLLLQALRGLPDRVVEFSSLLRPEERREALEAFRSGEAKVLVCSDAMTRGMDVEGVSNVVNYDAPVYVKTYVHRAGRTARAGRSGRVFTLLRHEDVKHFKGMLRKADNTYVRDKKLGREALEAVKADVEQALALMQEKVLEGAGKQAAEPSGAAGKPSRKQQQGQAQQGQQVAAAQGRSKGAAAAKRRKLAGVSELNLMAC